MDKLLKNLHPYTGYTVLNLVTQIESQYIEALKI